MYLMHQLGQLLPVVETSEYNGAGFNLMGEQTSMNLGFSVTPIAANITREAGRDAVLKTCPNPNILVANTGGPRRAIFANGIVTHGYRQ